MTTTRTLFNPVQVAAAIRLLHAPGAVFELRILGARLKDRGLRFFKAVSGFFDNPESAVKAVERIEYANGVYITFNAINPALLNRSINRFKEDSMTDFAVKDCDVIRRAWFLVDLDPSRPKGISATNDELEKAKQKATDIHAFLKERGWNEPVQALSGNGFHLLYRIDLPADDDGLLQHVLLALSQRFDDDGVEVDKSVHNPSRITKLYGTPACKGDHSEQRPHRMSEITHVPAALGVVTKEQLEQVAAMAVDASPTTAKQGKPAAAVTSVTQVVTTGHALTGWDAHAFIRDFTSKHGIQVTKIEDKGGDTYHMLQACPWASEHGGADTPGDSAIIVQPDGRLGFKCFHSHCANRHWRDLRLHFEPDFEQRMQMRTGGEPRTHRTDEQFYYDSTRKEYLLKNGRGVWLRLTEAQFRKELASRGYRTKAGDGETVSAVDAYIIDIRDRNDVVFSGLLAGHSAGFYEMGAHRMLVTSSPRIIEPKPGQFATLFKFLSGLFDEKGLRQLDYVIGWLKVGYEALRGGTRRPGQALAIAGPHNCGKSVFQAIVTEIFGGRYARPFQFMMGLTQFNSDLFEAEHLLMEDEQSSTDIRARRNFGSQIKQVTVVDSQRYHAKNCPALSLKPFWRLTISLNDETENLMVLPPLDDSLEDKMIILRAHRSPMPMPTETQEQRQAFWARLTMELPAFLDWLLGWEIPEGMRSQRFGVAHFHHPAILAAVDALSPEARLLSIIDGAIFVGRITAWEGTADGLEKELTDRDSEVSFEARRLFTFNTACGVYLGRLAKKHPGRFQHTRGGDCRSWTIHPPGMVQTPRTIEISDGVTGYFHVEKVNEVIGNGTEPAPDSLNCQTPRHPVIGAGPETRPVAKPDNLTDVMASEPLPPGIVMFGGDADMAPPSPPAVRPSPSEPVLLSNPGTIDPSADDPFDRYMRGETDSPNPPE